MSQISFTAIKQAVPITAMINHYLDTPLVSDTEQVRIPCIICDYDKTDCLSISTVKNLYKCFHCGSAGNILDFISDIEGVDIRGAGEILAKRHNVPATSAAIKKPTTRRKREATTQPEAQPPCDNTSLSQELIHTAHPVMNIPLKFELKGIDSKHKAVESLGLDEVTVTRFGIGYYSGRGHFKDHLIAPIHNGSHELIGYFSMVDVDGEMEISFPPSRYFNSEVNLYNEHRVIHQENGRGDSLYITSSPLAVIDLYSKGISDAVAFLGDIPSPLQCANIDSLIDQFGYSSITMLGYQSVGDENMGIIIKRISSLIPWYFK